MQSAHAQSFELRGELGGGSMLSSYQRNTDSNRYGSSRPGFAYGGQASVRGGVSFASLVALELGVSGWLFQSSTQPMGSVNALLAGIRLEPRFGTGRIVVDAHGGLALTGPLTRPTADAGLGYELRVAQGLTIGPALRVGAVFADGTDPNGDASTYRDAAWFGSLGIAGTWRSFEPPPPDADHDGIPDRDDLCPNEPGDPPDPKRRGCPLADTDGDGVFDENDVCPSVPKGPHPDPARTGCPLADSDGDGVFDNVDRCPTTHAGASPDPDRPGCPDGDDDGDRVVNHSDVCPKVPAGVHADPNRPGCPSPDRDGDGIPDDTDHCPDKPGAPHPDPKKNGCPGLVMLTADQLKIRRPVFFATGKDTILKQSYPVLQAVADALKAVPEIKRISVEGHTDDRGNDEFNLELSTRRAHSVLAWLLTHGVEPERLESHGFGKTKPLIPNSNNVARAANRRVEFRIVDPSPKSD